MPTRSSLRPWARSLVELAAFSSAALAFSACSAEPGLRGRVLDGQGTPVAGVVVTAQAASSSMRYASISDDQGRFRIDVRGASPHEVVVADMRFRSPAATASEGTPVELRATPVPEAERLAPSAEWLALLPAGAMKASFLLDCTGCHQFNETRAMKGGVPRTAVEWNADSARMHQRFGPASGFPILSGDLAARDLGVWITAALAGPFAAPAGSRAPLAPLAPLAPKSRAPLDPEFTLTEYDLPGPDLPHDVAVDAAGRVLVTGMFTDRILVLDPVTGATEPVAIPVEHANPRAIEIDRAGDWWVLLGAAGRIARYEPAAKRWTSADIGFYGHSIAVDRDGAAWANDHFAREAPRLARVAPGAELRATFHAGPPFATAARGPSPIPYELRAAADGKIWLSLLHGNAVVAFDPVSGIFESFSLPDPDAGPRRFDLDADGALWIPGYSSSVLYRLDPAARRFDRFPLPVADALPYVVRVDPRSGDLWIGTGAADALFRFDPLRCEFTTYPVPTRGATMRHLAIDPRSGEVWIAYGASPAIHPTRIARLQRRPLSR